MSSTLFSRAFVIGVLALCVSGCALTNKSDPITPRFFTPDVASVQLTSAGADAAVNPAGNRPPLRLGRVIAGAHLREKIAYRTTAHEVGYYEERRWTERPDVFVKRALERRLFESGAFEHVVSGEAPTLEVEVLAFGEVRGDQPHAEVKLRVMLHDDRVVRYEETVAVDRNYDATAKGKNAEALAGAVATALATATDRIAQSIARMVSAAPR